MPAPFQVRDADRPGVDLGQWDESGNITIPGTMTVGALTGTAGTIVFAALVAAFVSAATTTDIITSKVNGEAANRFVLDADGTMAWGGGAGATDCNLYRYTATGLAMDGTLRMTNAQMLFGAAGDVNLYRAAADTLRTDDSLSVGQGLLVAEGANLTMGASVLVGGTVVVSTTKVTANSRVFLTCQTPGGTPGFLRVSARTAGTSFTILSSSGTDTSTVGWLLVEPTT